MSLTANSVGLLAGTFVETTEGASAIAGAFIVPFMLFGGFFSN